MKKKMGFSNKVLLGMALGAVAGLLIGEKVAVIGIVGDVFLRLLRMSVVPLIFANVVLAVAGMGDLRRLGKIGIKLAVIFLATTFVAAFIGILSAMVVKPGVGFSMVGTGETVAAAAPTFNGVILGFFPTNIMQAFAEGNMLQVITFAIFSGIAILLMKKEDQEKMLNGVGVLSRFIMKILNVVMNFTPYGVFALMAVTTGKYGTDVFGPLGKFIIAVYIGLILHAVFVYGGMYFAASGKNPITFFKKISPAWTTSLATCSTAATLPVSLRVCEEDLGLKKDIAGFTIPVGATMNMDGSGVWYGVVALFVYQAMGMNMSLTQMLIAVLTGVLMTLGSPGIPGGLIVFTAIFLQALGLPIEFAGLIGGVFRILDMGVTTCNVVGSIVVAAVLDAGEKKAEAKQAARAKAGM